MFNFGRKAACAAVVSCVGFGSVAQADVFFSEYIEGSSNNKAIEIYNSGVSSVDLTGIEVRLYNNGAVTPNQTFDLTGSSIDADGVLVLVNGSSSTAFKERADFTGPAVTGFNGDDALALYDSNTSMFLDIFGVIGQDPGSAWSGGGLSTQNQTLRRKTSVTTGVTTNPVSFDPSVQWDGFAIDTVDGLGLPRDVTGDPGPEPEPNKMASGLIISEVVDATLSGGLPKFVELTNISGGDLNLSEFSLGNFSGDSTTLGGGAAQVLPNVVLSDGDVFVVAYEFAPGSGDSSTFEDVYGMEPDLFIGPFINGDDPIALFKGAAIGDGIAADVFLTDIYGVIGIDGTGEAWDYTDGYARRLTSVTESNPMFDASEWVIGGNNSLQSSPQDDDVELALILSLTDPGEFDDTPGTSGDEIPAPAALPTGLIGLTMLGLRRQRRDRV